LLQRAATKGKADIGLLLACASQSGRLVIVKEKSNGVEDWMQKMTGHHWITHVVIILLLFAVFGWCFARTNSGQGPKMPVNRLTNIVISGVVAGVLIIIGFYLIAD
jgi:cytochrome c oxidase assembly factor CtaG